MNWTIHLSMEAIRQLESLPKNYQKLIGNALDRMSLDPFQGNIKALKGKEWKGRYRKAVGRHRIIFTISYEQRLI